MLQNRNRSYNILFFSVSTIPCTLSVCEPIWKTGLWGKCFQSESNTDLSVHAFATGNYQPTEVPVNTLLARTLPEVLSILMLG